MINNDRQGTAVTTSNYRADFLNELLDSIETSSTASHPAPPKADGPAIHPDFVESEIILHSVFLGLATVILLFSFLMHSEGQTAVFLPGLNMPMPETCSSKRLLGIDCPGCGMTRSFIAISHGNFSRAWELNRASFAVYAFVAIQIPWHMMQLILLKTKRRPIEWNYIYFTPVAVVIVLTINWVWKLWSLI